MLPHHNTRRRWAPAVPPTLQFHLIPLPTYIVRVPSSAVRHTRASFCNTANRSSTRSHCLLLLRRRSLSPTFVRIDLRSAVQARYKISAPPEYPGHKPVFQTACLCCTDHHHILREPLPDNTVSFFLPRLHITVLNKGIHISLFHPGLSRLDQPILPGLPSLK